MSGGTPPVTGRKMQKVVAGMALGAVLGLTACSSAPDDASGVVEAMRGVDSVDDAYAEYGFTGLPSNETVRVVASVPGYSDLAEPESQELFRELFEAAWGASEVEPSGITVYITEDALPTGERPRTSGLAHGTMGRMDLEELFGPWEKP